MPDAMTVEGLLAVAVTTLAGIVVMFWKQHQDAIKELREQNKGLRKNQADCQRDRQKLWEDRAQREAKLAKLEADNAKLLAKVTKLEVEHAELRSRYERSGQQDPGAKND